MRSKLSQWYYNIKTGIKNIIRWFPIIWNDRDWDQAYLQRIIEQKLRFMADNTKHWHVVRADRSRREMLICAELLKRAHTQDMQFPLGQSFEDVHFNYNSDWLENFDPADERGLRRLNLPKSRWPYYKYLDAKEHHYHELLFKIMSKKINTWWD